MASQNDSIFQETRSGFLSGYLRQMEIPAVFRSRRAILLGSTSPHAFLQIGIGNKRNVTKLPRQLESILSDMHRAYMAKLYYPALLVALTLPEICMSLTLDKDRFVNGKHYAAFVDKYTEPHELGLNGESCYRLRGGVVHRGNAAGHPFFGTTHVIFSVPETRGGMHALSIVHGEETAAMFDLGEFCRAMDAAVKRWFADHQNDERVTKAARDLLSLRPAGVHPFFVGAPVVASGPEIMIETKPPTFVRGS